MNDYLKVVDHWRKKNITDDARLAEALNSHSISYAFHSGKMENPAITYNDTREIFDHDGVVSYTGDLRTLFEIRNSKDANELMLCSFNERRIVDESLVLDFHRELAKNTYDERRWRMGERPGEYKKHDYVTGREEVGASPDDAGEELRELLDEINDAIDTSPVINKETDASLRINESVQRDESCYIRDIERIIKTAAYFHVKFENIHPFADGNGRVGRIVMNYLLLLLNHPLIIIHEEDRKEYYSALESWDTDQDLNPMVDFLKSQTIKTWRKQI